ncbi:hypothetical protein [Flavobacterium hercynium]|uniref:Uncharacterized protein n=1 Tax=Flavobacterium hercynium TaxID=387094 RepID=A0A226GVJ7_9FLAO|nr:hypothetical protein [Flavobacterium hercynium]OXA85461.1 hypothetical protein B0A66_19495 [Flavobacterium hercynium]SMP16660.1 hypothetical protein SAMN06265346_10561 [Flavobacterium hercynium]
MKTKNIEGLSVFEINMLVQQGGRFIVYPAIMNQFKKTPIAYFVRANESSFKYAMNHFVLNLRVFHRRPFSVIRSMFDILGGGEESTEFVLMELTQNNHTYTPDIHFLQAV